MSIAQSLKVSNDLVKVVYIVSQVPWNHPIECEKLPRRIFYIPDLRTPQDVSIAHYFLSQRKHPSVCISYKYLMRSTQENATISFH